MSIRNLERMFEPRSIAVVGASDKPQRIATRVLANLVEGGYEGAIWPLNPRHDRVHGLRCYHKVAALPAAPDLAILCTPAATIPGLIAELGARGTRAAIVMTAGLEAVKAGGGRSVRQAMLEAARPHLLRILGAGSVGLQVPALALNASFSHLAAGPGKLAFVSQSGALGAAVLDWAALHGIGFSSLAALGETADIDFGDLLDYLAGDPGTEAILLCIESVVCARKFMSAGRLAARGKPVIVLKVGRGLGGDAGVAADLAFDAAVRRAGMLRVDSTEDLFDAVETLARKRPQRGERLAVLSNGASLALIASDALLAGGAQLAPLSPDTLQALRGMGAPPANPCDLLADVPVERYTDALEALLREPQADALLFLHAPTAMVDSRLIAEAVAPLLRAAPRNVLSCWLGGASVAAARRVFADAGLPSYDTPEKAVRGFLQIAQYRRNQELLMEVPAGLPTHAAAAPQRAAARALAEAVLAAGRVEADVDEARVLLAAYGIALAGAEHPARRGDGAGRPQVAARIRVSVDAVFGPLVWFGQGGLAAGMAAEQAAGLPPLNMVLARDMLGRAGGGRVARLLAPDDAGMEALCRALVRVADMLADLPQLAELDIDPLLYLPTDGAESAVVDGMVDGKAAGGAGGVLALAARLRLAPASSAQAWAIRPYPQELEEEMDWDGGRILLRPIRPEDAPQHVAFFKALAPDDVRLRFFSAMRELPPAQLARLTQIDYDRAMAFIATRVGPDGTPETLGVVRAVADPDNQTAEFAIIVRSDLKGRGLGYILFQKLLDYLRSRGTGELCGEALSENGGVQKLLRHFGGVVLAHPEAGMVRLQLPLR